MIFNTVWFCLRRTAASLVRNFWLGAASAGMIAVSVAILAAFLLVAVNAGQMIKFLESQVEINVFLSPEAERWELRDRIQSLDGVTSVTFISKEQALKEMAASLGEKADLLTGLEDDNPLPDAFRVRASSADVVPAIAREIEFFPGVDKVRYGQGIVEKIVLIGRWLNVISLGVAALLALAAVFLIVTTIRLSVAARQQEVSIMKFLGASNWFVRAPFLLEGMIIGGTGAIAAVTGIGAAYYYLTLQVARVEKLSLLWFWQPVTDPQVLLPLAGGLLLLGIIMGGLGSIVSIKKYLKV
ncbi:MAG: ABC transporter permease [Peptococcaceae bacterium]|nr:ABC transporter permease [Peptococcaceae bacterium]